MASHLIRSEVGTDAGALLLDDVTTAHLDQMAEEEGYQRKAPRL
jgi:hypothetical protein